MANFIFDKERWQKFGHWLRSRRILMVGSPERAGRLVGISGGQWQMIEQGSVHLDREAVICLSEALLSDITEACNQAGYSPPDDYVHIPLMIRLLNYLPPHIKADIAEQVKALHDVYFDKESKQRPAAWYYAARELDKEMRRELKRLEDKAAIRESAIKEAEKAAAELDVKEIIELDDDNIA